MKRNRTVASGSTIEGGGAMLVSPSRVSETGCGTTPSSSHRRAGASKLAQCQRTGWSKSPSATPSRHRPGGSGGGIRGVPAGGNGGQEGGGHRIGTDAVPKVRRASRGPDLGEERAGGGILVWKRWK